MHAGRSKHLNTRAQQYVRTASAIINESIEDQGWQLTPKGIWLYLDMVFYFKDRRVQDAQNCLKLLLDIMQGRVYQNDMNALPRIQGVDYDKQYPRLELCITHQKEKDLEKAIILVN